LGRGWGSYFCCIAIILVGTQVAMQPALAEDAVEAVMQVVGCSPLKDDKDRLACFDKAAATLKTAGVPSGPETANTREIVSSFAPGDFKVVDPDDIHVAPRKFVGKPIEIRNAKCFYADKDDYRCMAPSRGMVTTVFATSVGPANEKEALETDCGAIKKIDSPACRRTIRIVPVDFAEDAPNAFAKRIVVKVANIEIIPAARSRQQR
jgi:hypothetical protein